MLYAHDNKTMLPELEQAAKWSFIGFFSCMLICNAMLTSLFGVRSFTPSAPCFDKVGETNITLLFDSAFVGGFTLCTISLLYHGFVDPLLRQKRLSAQTLAAGHFGKTTRIAVFYVELTLAAFMFLLSAASMMLLYSTGGLECTQESQPLS